MRSLPLADDPIVGESKQACSPCTHGRVFVLQHGCDFHVSILQKTSLDVRTCKFGCKNLGDESVSEARRQSNSQCIFEVPDLDPSSALGYTDTPRQTYRTWKRSTISKLSPYFVCLPSIVDDVKGVAGRRADVVFEMDA